MDMSSVPDVNQQWSRVQCEIVKNKRKEIYLKQRQLCDPTTDTIAPWTYKECYEDTAQ